MGNLLWRLVWPPLLHTSGHYTGHNHNRTWVTAVTGDDETVTGENDTILTVFAEEAVREAEFASAVGWISATITREQLLLASGLGGDGAVILESSAIEEVCHGGEEVPDGVKELGIGGHGSEDGQEDGDGSDPHGVCSLSRLALDTMMIVWPCLLHSTPYTLDTRRCLVYSRPRVCHHYRHNIWEIASPISPLRDWGK